MQSLQKASLHDSSCFPNPGKKVMTSAETEESKITQLLMIRKMQLTGKE